MNKISFGIMGAIGAASLVFAAPALAHAKLVTSSPADHASLPAVPKVISLTFNEELVPAFSKFELTMPEHGMAIPLKTSVTKDGKTILGRPARPLTKGAYRIVWTAATADGHKMSGELGFKVG